MTDQKSVTRKRPELVTLPEVPMILKISEIPTGVWVMRINIPFTLTHLAQKGVQQAYVCINTGKSIMTFLGEETARITQIKAELKSLFGAKYPLLQKHVNITINSQITFGSRGPDFSPFYMANVPKLVEQLDACGFSKLPMTMFSIPIKHPETWVTFIRRAAYDGFILTQVGDHQTSGEEKDIGQLQVNNEILQKLGCYICQTSEITGKYQTCLVKSKQV